MSPAHSFTAQATPITPGPAYPSSARTQQAPSQPSSSHFSTVVAPDESASTQPNTSYSSNSNQSEGNYLRNWRIPTTVNAGREISLFSPTATIIVTLNNSTASSSSSSQPQQPETLTISLNARKKVTWKEGTVDNEFMQKKSSKKCCIFHTEKSFDSGRQRLRLQKLSGIILMELAALVPIMRVLKWAHK